MDVRPLVRPAPDLVRGVGCPVRQEDHDPEGIIATLGTSDQFVVRLT